MPAHTTMLHVRVDEELKTKAAAALEGLGMTLSDAVRILLTRIAAEGGMPPGLTADADSYDTWFRAKVQEALDDPRPPIPQEDVMRRVQNVIDSRRREIAG